MAEDYHVDVSGCGLDLPSHADPTVCPDPVVCPDPWLVAALSALPESLTVFFAPHSDWSLHDQPFAAYTRHGVLAPFPHAEVQRVLHNWDHTAQVTSSQIQALLDRVRWLQPQIQQRYPSIQGYNPSLPARVTAHKIPGKVVLHYEQLVLWVQATRPPVGPMEHALARTAPTAWIPAPTTAHARAALAHMHPVLCALFSDRPLCTRARIAHMGSTVCAIGKHENTKPFSYVWAATPSGDPSDVFIAKHRGVHA